MHVKSREIIDDGWLATVKHDDFWHCGGSGRVTFSRPIYAHTGDSMIPSYVTVFPPITDTELLLKIKNEAINIGVLLAEMDQTVSMFRNMGKSMLDTYRDVKKGKFKKLLASGSKNAPNSWMLYRYGLTSFWSDVEGAQKLHQAMLNRSLVRKFELHRSVVTQKRLGNYVLSDSSVTSGPQGYVLQTDRARTKRVVWAEYNSNLHPNMGGLVNLLSVGYEVIPYSFVLDHVINFGDYLASIDALANVKRYSSVTIQKSSREESWPKSSVVGHSRTYVRSVDSALLNHFPTWEPSGNWKHVVDLGIILKNLRRSFS
jgi:hypothetical protein